MRRLSWAVAVALPLLASPLARAEGEGEKAAQRVAITQLPPAVQDTFQAEVGNGRVEDLRKESTATGDRYAGQVVTEGQATDIEVDAKGVVVKRSPPKDETPDQHARDR